MMEGPAGNRDGQTEVGKLGTMKTRVRHLPSPQTRSHAFVSTRSVHDALPDLVARTRRSKRVEPERKAADSKLRGLYTNMLLQLTFDLQYCPADMVVSNCRTLHTIVHRAHRV